MPTYNKLIRDKIPGIIAMTGKEANTSILSDADYIKELKKKSQEELQEYLAADNEQDALEELADLVEVIYALAKVHGSSFEKLEEVREKKADQRGGFNDKVFLIDVE